MSTGILVSATFPVEDGEAVADGQFAIRGVVGISSRIQLVFLKPSSLKMGRTLTTGNVTDISTT